MKLYNAKYLVALLGIAGLFTITNQSYAFFTQAPSYICSGYPDCTINLQAYWRFDFYNSTSTSSTDQLYYLKTSCTDNNTCSSNGSAGIRTYGASGNSGDFQIVSHNPGEYIQYRTKTSNSVEGTYNTFTYNFIKLASDGEGYNYYWRNEQDKSYNYKWILLNGYVNNSLPNERFIYYEPRHASFVFYNQNYLSGLHTIQFIGNYELVDKFVYVDPIANGDNVFFVDVNKMLAYSTYVDDKEMLSQLLFGVYPLNDDFFNNFGWDKWYDVQFGGNYFFPQTYGNFSYPSNQNPISLFSNGGGRKSHPYKNIGLVYNKRLDEVVQPNYGGGSSSGASASSGYFTYEQCLSYTNDISTIANYQKSCRNAIDYQCSSTTGCLSLDVYNDYRYSIQNADFSYITNIYTGNTDCNMWFGMTMTLYNRLQSGGNNLGSLNYGSIISSINAYSNSDEVFDNVNYCKQLNDVSGDTWLCKFTGIGCDDSFGSIYDMVKANVMPFITEPINEVVREFDRGYNFIGSGNSCVEPYGKTYIWGNYFVIVLVGCFVIFLYGIFKE